MRYRTVADICRRVEQEAQGGGLSEALILISDFVADIISKETSRARVFSSPQLDEMCLRLGRNFGLPVPTSRDPDRAVFIVTALYKGGGHSRVLLDIARADPCRKIHVLVTNLRHDYLVADIRDIFAHIGADPNFDLEIAPSDHAADRLRWLQQRLFELRPIRTYLLQHYYDSLCIAAAQAELVGNLFYVHHCDNSLALGVHIPHATHVDLAATRYYCCREDEGVKGNVIWPLTADVAINRVSKPFLVNGLKTCTSGLRGKFDTSLLQQHIPYSITYPQIVPLILSEGGGTHLHIGILSEQMLQDIKTELDNAGIAQSRFEYIQHVPSLADALLEHNVDAYIGSFPIGGGRATIEAMGVGLPLIIHSNYRSDFFSASSIIYEGAMTWRTPAELAAHLRSLTEQRLALHAKNARQYFEEHHSKHLLRETMQATFAANNYDPPARRAYHPDMLQTFLDEQWALEIADQGRAAEMERARRTDELLQRAESANSFLAAQNGDLVSTLLQSSARLTELQRLTESSGFIFKAAWKKIVNTPRDIIRRILRSRER